MCSPGDGPFPTNRFGDNDWKPSNRTDESKASIIEPYIVYFLSSFFHVCSNNDFFFFLLLRVTAKL